MKKNVLNGNDLIFSSLKVKKIIQENKEIGKIANMSPYVISKSLEFFINDILKEASLLAKDSGNNTISCIHIKETIMKKENYSFLKELVQDIEDNPKSRKKPKQNGTENEGNSNLKSKSQLNQEKKSGNPSSSNKKIFAKIINEKPDVFKLGKAITEKKQENNSTELKLKENDSDE